MEFKKCHPIVNFIYFCAVMGFSMFFMYPIILAVSFLFSFGVLILIKGKKALTNLSLAISLMLLTVFINPLISHEGVTALAYFPSGNPLTLESIVFGIASAVMLGSIVLWFSGFNDVMTSDKLMSVFGGLIPSLSMTFSVILRLVPRCVEQFRKIEESQKGLGMDLTKGRLAFRFKNGTRVLSALTTIMLESTAEMTNSMKGRGYELRKKSHFSLFVISRRDICLIIFEFAAIVYILFGYMSGAMYCNFYPKLKFGDLSIFSASVVWTYLMLCSLPIYVELWGRYKWKLLK